MNKLVNSNTDLIVTLAFVSSIALTFLKIMDVKDFGAMAMMILAYKFGKGQAMAANNQIQG
jgi:hypothetical protein